MNAIIPAAGIGKRMQPITHYIPKALLPIVYRPLIEIIITQLMKSGIEKIGINLFHKADVIQAFLHKFQTHLSTVLENELSGTGGALRNFTDFFTEDIIVHNGDVLSNINLGDAVKFHTQRKPMATLLVTKNPGTNVINLNSHYRITDISTHDMPDHYTFTGIAILSKKIADYFPKRACFSIIDIYRRLIDEDAFIVGLPTKEQWYDIGSHYAYWKVHHDILNRKVTFKEVAVHTPLYIHHSSIVHTENITGFVSIGPGCYVAEHVSLNNTIIFAKSRIEKGNYTNCLLSKAFCISVQ
ncbi:MAG: NDP-sugar synthase [candidate division WOR-3 bacterium]|nr:MAG: NDP-sugar synthase [candidate division WOR-3 bacterium]